jgi:hypothetical protein
MVAIGVEEPGVVLSEVLLFGIACKRLPVILASLEYLLLALGQLSLLVVT